MSKYKMALQEIQDTLYGKNIELTNWHLNGNTEPFDNFAEDHGWFDDLDSQDDQPTLRDEFAKAALGTMYYADMDVQGIAEIAYAIADAMLKERSK